MQLPGTLSAANAITIGDYTAKPVVDITGFARLNRILVQIKKTTGNIDLQKYGSGTLTDGIILSMKDASGTIFHQFNPKPLTTIADWTLLAGRPLPEADKNFLSVRFSLFKGSDSPHINIGAGEYFSFEIFEDLTGLTLQYIQLQGEYVPWL